MKSIGWANDQLGFGEVSFEHPVMIVGCVECNHQDEMKYDARDLVTMRRASKLVNRMISHARTHNRL